ncbi:MAG: hypothetical protein KF851_12825 [Pirellulaceae bacterium]|nr:hypothetical protein [Pirellulaceae bacterium]
MAATVNELISKTTENTTATVVCKLVGTIDGEFMLIDRNEQEFSKERSIPVLIEGLLKDLLEAGLQPRGGGVFPYGGNAMIRGAFKIDHNGSLSLIDYENIEIEVHRRRPVLVSKCAVPGQ